MGYYTKFELDVVPDDAFDTIRGALALRAYKGTSPFLADGGWPEHGCKWYSWREDCHAVSLEHPSVTFVVTGEGERGERWRSVWRGGTEVYQPLGEVTPTSTAGDSTATPLTGSCCRSSAMRSGRASASDSTPSAKHLLGCGLARSHGVPPGHRLSP
jgi:hypothetical protein